MTITQLRYTLAVAEHGNFTTASDKCFVTQPTLSMQVQKLEEELGVIIFNRSTKPLQVTEIGEKVLSQAKKIVEIMKTAPANVKGGRAWYDNSDAMTDYFDTAYYTHINVGKWDKPYEFKAK